MKAARLSKVAWPSCEIVSGCESHESAAETYRLRAVWAAAVDELADGVGVVGEVWGEVGEGAGVAVVVDERLEVVGNGRGFVVGHAGSLVAVLGAGDERRCHGGNGEEAGYDEGAHFGGISGVGWVLRSEYRPASCSKASDVENGVEQQAGRVITSGRSTIG
jgi:hypothetical protein